MGHALTSKGQVTLPKRIREHLGLKPGDRVEFAIRSDGAVVVEPGKAEAPQSDDWADLRGIWKGPPADEFLLEVRGPPDETAG